MFRVHMRERKYVAIRKFRKPTYLQKLHFPISKFQENLYELLVRLELLTSHQIQMQPRPFGLNLELEHQHHRQRLQMQMMSRWGKLEICISNTLFNFAIIPI